MQSVSHKWLNDFKFFESTSARSKSRPVTGMQQHFVYAFSIVLPLSLFISALLILSKHGLQSYKGMHC